MSGHALLDGEPVRTFPLSDRGCRFGDGVFETIAVVDGRPALWNYHVERLQTGCRRLALEPPPPELLREEATRLCRAVERGVLRIFCTAGEGRGGYARAPGLPARRLLQIEPGALAEVRRPLRLCTARLRLAVQPALAGIKHLNRLEQVLARSALPDDCDEALLFDTRGRLVEAIAANVFVEIDGAWLTPPCDEAGVAGTVRRLLLERGGEAGFEARIAPIDPAMLARASAIVLTGSLSGVRPAGSLDGRALAHTRRSPALERLHRAAFTTDGEIPCIV